MQSRARHQSRARYALIGAATLATVAVLFGLAFWFSKGRSDTIDVKLIFNGKVSGLGRGSRVLFNGLQIGEVKEVEIEPTDPRQIYSIIKISRLAPLRVDTSARLEGQGLAGIVAVQLRGGSPHAAPLTSAPGQPLPTIIAEASESIFEKVDTIAKSVDESLVGIEAAIQANAEPLTEKIRYAEQFSASLSDSSAGIDKLMKNVGSAAEFITPLPDKLKAFSEGFIETLRGFDKKQVASTIEDVDRLAATLAISAPDVGIAIKNVASTSEKLNGVADQAEGVLKGARSFLTAAAGENGRSAFSDVAEAAKSLRVLADNLDRSSAAVAAKIIQFAGDGRQSLETFTSSGRNGLSSFGRTLRDVNRNPQSLIFGSGNRIPQYGGSR